MSGVLRNRLAFRRVAFAMRGRPTWVHKIVAFVLIVILLGIAGALVVWGLIVAAVIAVAAAVMVGIAAVRRWLSGERSLRKNVRIVGR